MPYTPPPSQRMPRFSPYMNNTSPPPSQHTMRSSPFNTSPTSLFSPHIPAPCRQLHPPKVPLYRPAVLRSIERPIRLAREPLTPPASSAASLNEVYIGDVEYKTGVDFRNFGYGNCAYGNVADLGEIEDDDVQVTEEPDRGHWKVFITIFSLSFFPVFFRSFFPLKPHLAYSCFPLQSYGPRKPHCRNLCMGGGNVLSIEVVGLDFLGGRVICCFYTR